MDSFTNLIGLLCILGVFLGSSTALRHSMMCLDCKDIRDPGSCKIYRHCLEPCKTEVHFINGHYTFSFGCGGHHSCETSVHIHHPIPDPLGKRRVPHEEGDLACSECCNSTGCDAHTCSQYRNIPTTTTTTTTTTPAPTTGLPILDPTCRDYESDAFRCADLSNYNLCSDTSPLAYALAHEKCAKYCGFCSPYWKATSPQLTVTQTPCSDNEVQDFSCAEWKSFGFCAETSGAGYNIAKERCQKTCGFCA